MGNCSPAAWGHVTLAGAFQIAQKPNAEAIKSCLLCQNMNTHPIQCISKGELGCFPELQKASWHSGDHCLRHGPGVW